MMADESKCVNCHRCVSLCPTRALKIVKSRPHLPRKRQLDGRGHHRDLPAGRQRAACCCPPWATRSRYPVYWDKTAAQRVAGYKPLHRPAARAHGDANLFLGKKPTRIQRDANGEHRQQPAAAAGACTCRLCFRRCRYGSISYNAHESLARAAQELGIYYNTGEGGLHEDFYQYGANTIVQVASGRFGVHKDYLEAGAAIEIKMGQGAKPGIGGHLPGAKDRRRRIAARA